MLVGVSDGIYNIIVHHRPHLIHSDGWESERNVWDPKDGELCVLRLKEGETLLEGRSNVDVQIAYKKCAMGRKTNRTIE